MHIKQLIERLVTGSEPMERIEQRLNVHLEDVPSPTLGAPVPVAVLEGGGELDALYIHLDGGVGDRGSLVKRRRLIAMLMEVGVISANSAHASFSGGSSAFYTGAWEGWVTDELPRWINERFGAPLQPANTLLTGISGGGHGALKIAFKHPDRFKSVAAMEPVIMPALDWPEQHTRASWWMLEPSARAVWGEPFPDSFLANHPPNIAIANAEQIRNSRLDIYLEVGDVDLLNLQDGAAFLHRVLWEQDIAHEFHQVRWADHGGQSIDDRFIEAMSFLDASHRGGKEQSRDLELSEDEQRFVDYVLSGGPMSGKPFPEDASQGSADTELSVMAKLWEPLRLMAEAQDPDMRRRYGRLPKHE